MLAQEFCPPFASEITPTHLTSIYFRNADEDEVLDELAVPYEVTFTPVDLDFDDGGLDVGSHRGASNCNCRIFELM